MLNVRRILVPIDFSKEAELAVEWAVRLAKEETDATILLLHSLTPISFLPPSTQEAGNLTKERIKQAKTDLKVWLDKVPLPMTSAAIYAEGDLVQAVCATCKKEDIDLVVMATHGRQGLSRVMYPSIAEKIVRTAPCPVLVLHLTQKAEQLIKQVA